jgi:hypothetical protein
MPFYISRPLGSSFTTFLESFAQDSGLPFATVLNEEQIQQAAKLEGVCFGQGAKDVFTPAITLWAFVGQVLSGRKCCVAAVARIIVLLAALGRKACSAATGAYCRARAKLPEQFLRRLAYQVGTETEDQAPPSWRWLNRRVMLVDGTTSTLPDTPSNQLAYPQSRTQKPGLGFPILRLVVLLAFATATVIGAAWGPIRGKETGETALLRLLLDQLRAGDVVVADRYYCSYFMIALLRARGVDVAFRLHHQRRYDFRRGQRVGRSDHIVQWQRPPRPDWMDEETYASMPERLTIRELRFQIDEQGCRTHEIVMATTLLDHQAYEKDDIADLYHYRWHVELDLRSIKQTLKMKALVCKTPVMAHKELWAHLLGYNLARKAAAQAAQEHNLTPRQISFAGVVQTLEAFRDMLIASSDDHRGTVYEGLFLAIAAHRVADRPNRVEPRRLKRRDDKYQMLGRPRAEERAALLSGKA